MDNIEKQALMKTIWYFTKGFAALLSIVIPLLLVGYLFGPEYLLFLFFGALVILCFGAGFYSKYRENVTEIESVKKHWKDYKRG